MGIQATRPPSYLKDRRGKFVFYSWSLQLTQTTGSVFTCFGEVDEVVCDEILELPVFVRKFPQKVPEPPEERHDVQTVEGEAAGERQQAVEGAHRFGRRVRHQVSIHGAVEGRCQMREFRNFQKQHEELNILEKNKHPLVFLCFSDATSSWSDFKTAAENKLAAWK